MTRENKDKIKRIREDSIISKGESGEEVTYLSSLRPKKLDEYIGQKRVVENLQISIAAAKKRGKPLDHILFHGPPGLGKTTLAHIIANEMGASITCASGPTLERPADLMGILTKLGEGHIFFIDEIHRLPRIVEEFLYSAMEDFVVDFVIDRGPHARTIKFQLKRFTLIGATTRAGLLTPPLRERFGIFHHLDFYQIDDLVSIVSRSAKILQHPITLDGCKEIAHRSRGTPRIANRILRRVSDYALVKGDGKIDSKVADAALKMLGIDKLGLDKLDIAVLNTIIKQYGGGPVGINALAATLQEEEDTLIDVVEPYLLKIGFVNRTQRGRTATQKAYKHLGIPTSKGGFKPLSILDYEDRGDDEQAE